jgi:hypothetical protein
VRDSIALKGAFAYDALSPDGPHRRQDAAGLGDAGLQNPGGYPLIHALDTVRAVAHCVGLPWKATDQSSLSQIAMSSHGRTLAVHWKSGKLWLNVNTTTWRLRVAAQGPRGGGASY